MFGQSFGDGEWTRLPTQMDGVRPMVRRRERDKEKETNNENEP